jgi:hypothetical protein
MKYDDTKLIKYEDTIQLHFDTTGKIAWLTLKNYGSMEKPPAPFWANVVDATIGTPAGIEWNQMPGLKASEETISIAEMLSSKEISEFQARVIQISKANPENPFFLRKALTEIIENALGQIGFPQADLNYKENDPRFSWTTYVALRNILSAPPDPRVYEDIFEFKTINSNAGPKDPSEEKVLSLTFTAYFPRRDLELQEERTLFTEYQGPEMGQGYGPGKTQPVDVRPLKPIYGKLGRPPETGQLKQEAWKRVATGRFVKKGDSYEYQELFDELDVRIRKKKLNTGPDRVKIGKTREQEESNYLHRHLDRVSCYAFRGDDRGPLKIHGAGGFFPGVTRTDPGMYKKAVVGYISTLKKDKAAELKAAQVALELDTSSRKRFEAIMHQLMHLGDYTADQKFRGFGSATKSMAIAKAFSNTWEEKIVDLKSYCYAVFCKGGFLLPSHDVDGKAIEEQHKFAHFLEQEVAVPGVIPWRNDVVGMRAILCNKNGQHLCGPVFLQDRLRKNDPEAFSELFELLSGKSQGRSPFIEKQSKLPPEQPFQQPLQQPPLQPPLQPPKEPPKQPPLQPPLQPPKQPPLQPPLGSPLQPPKEPPKQPPLQPPKEPPKQPPLQPPKQPPKQPPVDPPTSIPVGGESPVGRGDPSNMKRDRYGNPIK